MLIFRAEVSCFSVTLFYSTLFCCGGKAYLVRFTLFYAPLLALTYRQTDRQTDEGTNLSWLCWPHPDGFLQVNPGCTGRTLTGSSRFILVGLATLTGSSRYTCFAWAGRTFFLVVLYVVSVFGSGGKKILVQFYLEYNTVVVVR